MFNIGIGSSCKDLVFSLTFFDTLKISSKGVLWSQRLLVSETLSSYGVKHIIRVLMYNYQSIAVAVHIIILVSFIAHPDVASFHGRDESKGC